MILKSLVILLLSLLSFISDGDDYVSPFENPELRRQLDEYDAGFCGPGLTYESDKVVLDVRIIRSMIDQPEFADRYKRLVLEPNNMVGCLQDWIKYSRF